MGSDDESSTKRRKLEEKDDEQGAESMSIDETNKLRAKLGLAPLEITTDEKADDGTLKADDGTSFHHVPAESITDKKKSEKLRKKIEERRKARKIDDKLKQIKGLGEPDSNDAVKSWIQRSRKLEKERKKAAKKEAAIRAREAEMEEEIRVLEEEKRQKAYNRNALAGMTVEHSLDKFTEGRDVVMTLKDSRILDEEDGSGEVDVLVNVNMVDVEKADEYKKNVKDAKNKQGYNPLEKFDAENVEMAAFGEKKLLSKYDETIDGQKKKKFEIGQDGNISTTMIEMRKQMQEEMAKNAISLDISSIKKVASDYYTPEEAQGFKKRKRKVKKERTTGMKLMDDVLERRDFETNPFDKKKDHGSRNWKRGENDDKKIKEEITITEEELDAQLKAAARNNGEKVVEDKVKKDVVVSSSLERTRRLLKSRAKMEMRDPALSLKERLQKISSAAKPEVKEEIEFKDELILNDVDEFVRAVGQANAEKIYEREKAQAKEVEIETKKESKMDIDLEVEQEFKRIKNRKAGIRERELEQDDGVEREPLASVGLAGAIKVAAAKGYIDSTQKKGVVIDSKHKERISAQTYSIEDKNRVDHLDKYAADKYRRDSRRDKMGSGMEFPELKDYKPNIQIEYVDDIGRPKTEKEAFRDLSHRFHGKGSGKMKQEKRQKRLHEESALQQMSSTDTPLNTVEMLRRKQKQTNSPFINLTGGAMLSAGAKNKLSKNN